RSVLGVRPAATRMSEASSVLSAPPERTRSPTPVPERPVTLSTSACRASITPLGTGLHEASGLLAVCISRFPVGFMGASSLVPCQGSGDRLAKRLPNEARMVSPFDDTGFLGQPERFGQSPGICKLSRLRRPGLGLFGIPFDLCQPLGRSTPV